MPNQWDYTIINRKGSADLCNMPLSKGVWKGSFIFVVTGVSPLTVILHHVGSSFLEFKTSRLNYFDVPVFRAFDSVLPV